MFTNLKIVYTLAVCAVLVACAETESVVDSDQVSTSEIHAVIHVVQDSKDDIAVVTTQLFQGVPNPTSSVYVNLVSPDRLIVAKDKLYSQEHHTGDLFSRVKESAEANHVMDKITKTNTSIIFGTTWESAPWYRTTFTGGTKSTEYIVALERDVDGGALNSVVRMPEPIFLAEPLQGANWLASAENTIRWNAFDATMDVKIRAILSCTSGRVDDKVIGVDQANGIAVDTYKIPAGTYSVFPGESCNLSLRIDRGKIGLVDQNLLSGEIVGHFQDSVSVYLQP